MHLPSVPNLRADVRADVRVNVTTGCVVLGVHHVWDCILARLCLGTMILHMYEQHEFLLHEHSRHYNFSYMQIKV